MKPAARSRSSEAGETVSHFAVLERLRAQSEVARGVSFGFSGGEHYAKLPLVGLAWPELKDALKRVVNYRGHLRHVFVRPIKGPDHFRALDGVRALAYLWSMGTRVIQSMIHFKPVFKTSAFNQHSRGVYRLAKARAPRRAARRRGRGCRRARRTSSCAGASWR